MQQSHAATPDEYIAAQSGWQRASVTALRKAVLATSGLEEVIKWGHLVYLSNGPVLLIRAESERVLLGFWRGKRLTDIEPRLVPSGKYEMATVVLRDGSRVPATVVRRLVKRAMELNRRHGDPRAAARRTTSGPSTKSRRSTPP